MTNTTYPTAMLGNAGFKAALAAAQFATGATIFRMTAALVAVRPGLGSVHAWATAMLLLLLAAAAGAAATSAVRAVRCEYLAAQQVWYVSLALEAIGLLALIGEFDALGAFGGGS